MMRTVAGVAGLLMAVVAATDAVHTLVVARSQPWRWWPTEVFYRIGWRAWSGLARHMRSERKAESFLAVYTPASFITLLVSWVAAIVVGFGITWWASPDAIAPIGDIGQSVYFSGISFLTIGFGDVVPTGGAARALVLVEGFFGLAIVALVIGFLPALYQAYHAREALLVTLDHPTRDQLRAIDLVGVMWRGGDDAEIRGFAKDWERWVAEVLTSHRSYPMLMYFRSQNPGQSWLTGLGLIADTATIALVMTDNPPPEVVYLHRRASRTLVALANRVGVKPKPGDPITREMFEAGLEVARSYGLRPAGSEGGFERMHALRSGYVEHLEALIDHLVSPRGFWGHDTASDPRMREGP
jgi:hypothetical protein